MDPHILVVSAVSEEVEGLVLRLIDSVSLSVGGRKVISGTLAGRPVRILTTGPGLTNTVQALSAAIEDSRPSLIVQTGSAGAFRGSGLRPGDIGIATEEIDPYLGIEPEHGGWPLEALPFPTLKKEGLEIRNRYPLDGDLADAAYRAVKAAFAGEDVGVMKGPFLTVATITATEKRAEELSTEYGACMEAMEGCGAAHLSLHYDLPLVEIRAASNFVGKRRRSTWNLPLARERGALAVYEFIRASPDVS